MANPWRKRLLLMSTAPILLAMPPEHNFRILGVGGGIGSGKSTACKLLVNELGCIAHIGRYLGEYSE